MSRVQLAINVSDLERSIDFYSRTFGTSPAKVRDGYANFAIVDPPLKLVLIESPSAGATTLNHLGVEVESTDEVVEATRRFQAVGDPTRIEEGVECCYARQDKVWVADPDGAEWEFYTVLGDSPQLASSTCCDDDTETACC